MCNKWIYGGSYIKKRTIDLNKLLNNPLNIFAYLKVATFYG